MVIGTTIACTNGVSPDTTGPTPTPPAELAADLRVDAGYDLFVSLPEQELLLRAQTANSVGSEEIRWTKIAGPSSYRLVANGRYSALATGLERGTYAFEIAVKQASGRVAFDTLAVHVVGADAVRTVDFPVTQWQCPMGCNASVGKLEPQIPNGAVLRVLLRPNGSSAWEEIRSVFDETFVYGIVNGTLELYAMDDQPPGVVRVLWTMPQSSR